MDIGFDQWLYRLALAALFAGLVGRQREVMQKQAGLRTHVLVGIGAALFTLTGIEGFEGGDEARVAAQVVTGVGFLGAGAIFREGANVRGLTTAAEMWAVAAIGITAGAGIIDGALLATVVALFVLTALGWAERRAHEQRLATAVPIRVKFAELESIVTAPNMLERIDPDAMDLALERQSDGTTVLSVPVGAEKRDLVETMMLACDGVIETG